MEERDPSKYHTLHFPSPSRRENYAVQVPQDQIHRIPPADHARIVEEHIRIASDPNKHSRRRTWFLIAGCVLLVGIVVAIIISILRATIYNPEPPQFSLINIRANNLDAYLKRGRPAPVFLVGLRATNKKPKMHASYKGGQVTLELNSGSLGTGKIPSAYTAHGANADFQVAITGKPSDTIAESLKGRAERQMDLSAVVTVEVSSWARSGKWDLNLYCPFTVKNSLAGRAAMITSQDCQAE